MSIRRVPSGKLSPLERDALLFGWKANTVMAMLYGFVDESGEFDSGGQLQRLSLGGFIATWESVQLLCEKWRAALDAETLGSFHMREIASDEYNYANWPQERQQRLDRFVDILCECGLRFFAFNYAVTMPSMAFYDTYETALSRVMINSEIIAIRYKEPVRLVFAKTSEIKFEMIGRYFDMSNWQEKRIEAVSQESSEKNPPLQAAEILARGIRAANSIRWPVHSFDKILLHCAAHGKELDYVISGQTRSNDTDSSRGHQNREIA